LGPSFALPSLIGLQFWECDLVDSFLFFEYGIPSAAVGGRQNVITVVTRPSMEISVRVADSSSEYTYKVAPEDTLAQLRDIWAADLDSPSETLRFTQHGNPLDDSTRFGDLEDKIITVQTIPQPPLISEPEPPLAPPPPELIEYAIYLQIGTIPRMRRIKLPPTATVADAEERARAIWELGELDVQVVLMDLANDTSEIVPKTEQMSALDLQTYMFTVVKAASLADTGPSDFVAVDRPMRDDPRLCCDDAEIPGEVLYCFRVVSLGTELRMSFPPGATIRDAKVRIAGRCDVPPGDVTLLFSGKLLKDGFILNRLRIGDQKITVRLPDTSELLCLTARALR
jgi:hypothetical protein